MGDLEGSGLRDRGRSSPSCESHCFAGNWRLFGLLLDRVDTARLEGVWIRNLPSICRLGGIAPSPRISNGMHSISRDASACSSEFLVPRWGRSEILSRFGDPCKGSRMPFKWIFLAFFALGARTKANALSCHLALSLMTGPGDSEVMTSRCLRCPNRASKSIVGSIPASSHPTRCAPGGVGGSNPAGASEEGVNLCRCRILFLSGGGSSQFLVYQHRHQAIHIASCPETTADPSTPFLFSKSPSTPVPGRSKKSSTYSLPSDPSKSDGCIASLVAVVVASDVGWDESEKAKAFEAGRLREGRASLISVGCRWGQTSATGTPHTSRIKFNTSVTRLADVSERSSVSAHDCEWSADFQGSQTRGPRIPGCQ